MSAVLDLPSAPVRPEPMLTTAEVAVVLNKPISTIQRLVRTNTLGIPVVRVGQSFRFPAAAVRALAEGRIPNAA